jgi:hypothetical protein
VFAAALPKKTAIVAKNANNSTPAKKAGQEWGGGFSADFSNI